MKRIFIILMCLSLVLTSMVFAHAETDAILSIKTIDGPVEKGEYIKLPITLANWEKGYESIEFNVNYDNTVLKLESIEGLENDFLNVTVSSAGDWGRVTCSPKDAQTERVDGIEVCVATFVALADIKTTTAVELANVEVAGYSDIGANVKTGSAVVSNGSGKKGETVTVIVSLGENTELAAYGATLVYDETALKLVSMDKGEFCATVNVDRAFVTGHSNCNKTTGTVLFYAIFEILAVSGNYNIDVSFDENSTADENDEVVEMNVTAGEICVVCEHNGGEATCVAKAKCAVCGQAYGGLNSNNHKNTETKNITAENCGNDGYSGDVWCLDCNTIIEEGKTVPSTGNHIGGEATCKDKAVCSVCGQVYGELNSNNHKGETEIRNNVVADCGNAGYTGDTYCKDCQKVIKSGEAIPATGNHTGGEATCKDKAVCSVCGQAYGELNSNNHKGETEIRYASATYTGDTYCLDCGEMIAKGEKIVIDAAVIIPTILGAVSVGQEIAIPINVAEWGNGYSNIEFELVYDDTVLKLVSIEPSKKDFDGADVSVDGNKFSLTSSPSNQEEADKVNGGEVCIACLIRQVYQLMTR